MIHLDTPIQNLPRVTDRYAKTLSKLGILTARDLLYHLPSRYDDFRRTVPISEKFLDQNVTIEGRIMKAKNIRTWKKRMTVTEIFLEDSNGSVLKAVWFNQPYILDGLRAGIDVRLSGKLVLNEKNFFMTNPAWERSARDTTNTGRLVPIYPETKGLTSKWLRWQIKELLPLAEQLPDVLPSNIREKYNLYDIFTTLTQLHFPESREKIIRAQKRLAFSEMFIMQLQAQKLKQDREKERAPKIAFDEKLIKDFVRKLPFSLTNAQKKASFEILKDLENPTPMNRLLNGDVGSGKTVVAAITALQTTSSGFQVAIMAPTEVLARQHYSSFCELFNDYRISIALLTSSHKETNDSKLISNSKKIIRENLLNDIANGKIDLVIGTHALIQKDVRFKNLALVIIDEQHRFGVEQRSTLQKETADMEDGRETTIPHLLTMTATPIPRTLSIAFFGSLDLSFLDEMPRNRKPIITQVITPEENYKIYTFIKSEVKKGRQAFIILPLVEESLSESMADVKAVTAEHKRLSKKVFPQLKLGIMHGRLKAKEKEEVMQKFKNHEFDILVSTSVVEVGVDVPNATVMIIENAERFGLTQLHQFRGRVGRGNHQSYCFLFSETKTERLRVMTRTNNGFEIAEKDLELRGPGQFFGTLQSGLPDITMENLKNLKLIKFARAEATEILKDDPELKRHPVIMDALQKFTDKVHLE